MAEKASERKSGRQAQQVARKVSAQSRGMQRPKGKALRSQASSPARAAEMPPPGPRFPIVGVGASAGGLEAFSQLLQSLPPDSGMAIVLIQHLAPKHESALAMLLSGSTPLPVAQATHDMVVQPNHVYVIPPNSQMGIANGRLQLAPRPEDRTQYTPVDSFFRSLAEYAEGFAIGVVLSGTASDGAVGLRDIKAAGGITIAQDPETARYDGMPRAAIATNVVDLVLAPQQIAEELVHLSRHPLVRHVVPRREGDEVGVSDDHLVRIFQMLRNATGVDFTHYKQPTIRRRLQRRMVLHKIESIEQYIRYMQQHPEETKELYQDLLIHVTRFFREAESSGRPSSTSPRANAWNRSDRRPSSARKPQRRRAMPRIISLPFFPMNCAHPWPR